MFQMKIGQAQESDYYARAGRGPWGFIYRMLGQKVTRLERLNCLTWLFKEESCREKERLVGL